MFQINGGIVKDLATGIATVAPKAFVLVISNPVNSTVPIVAEVFKHHGVYDPKRCVKHLLTWRICPISYCWVQNLWCYYTGCCTSIHVCG